MGYSHTGHTADFGFTIRDFACELGFIAAGR